MIRCFSRWVIVISLASSAHAASENLLERVGDRVKLFWDQFAAVTCTEEMVQEKLNDKGNAAVRSASRYDYLILLGWDKGDLLVDESRVEVDAPRKGRPTGSLLATRGFATLQLILHPDFQSSYTFSAPVTDGALERIDFLPHRQGRSPGAMELKGREYPIQWAGSAWVDPGTAAVVRIDAHWSEPPVDLGLKELHSDVHYKAVDLRLNDPYWLPESALIELKTQHQSWRNEHRFKGYRLFSVDVKDGADAARQAKEDQK